MLLQFITERSIGPEERHIIRSHVMKGKNAGKSRSARRTLIHRSVRDHAAATDSCPETSELMKHTLAWNRMLWNELTLASFPEHVGPETTKLVYHRTYHTRLNNR
jgi:hypothetical protein